MHTASTVFAHTMPRKKDARDPNRHNYNKEIGYFRAMLETEAL
jgi:hypothetical protein